MRSTLRVAAGTLGFIVGCGVGGAAADEAGAMDESRFEVVVNEGLLTVRAEEVPAAQLLEAIGAEAGLEIRVKGEAGPPISTSLVDQPVEEALRRLLRDRSAAMVFEHADRMASAGLRPYGCASWALPWIMPTQAPPT